MGNDEVDLWATDEVHFQQHGSRCRMWVPPETKDPCCGIIRRGAVWDTSVPYGCGMENFSFLGKQVNLTP